MRSAFFKFLILFLFSFISFPNYAQRPKMLEQLTSEDYRIKPGQSIVYGNFVARNKKWSSGGYAQFVWIKNTATNKEFLLEGIRYMKNKNDVFSFHLPAGTYEITRFSWTSSKIIYYLNTTELVFKNLDVTDSVTLTKYNKGEIQPATLQRFSFTIEPGKMYYLGNWDFSEGIAKFSDTKVIADKRMKKDFIWIDFDAALTVIPD